MIKYKLLVNPTSKESLKTLFDKIKAEPEEVEVFICNKKFTRSKAQRGYFFGYLVVSIANFTGYSRAETNELLKLTYNPKELEHAGRTIVYGGSIEAESTKRCEEIFEQIRADFAQMDLHLHEPRHVTNDQYVSINELYKAYEDENI